MKSTLNRGLLFLAIFLTWHLISHFWHLYGTIEYSDVLSHFLSGIGFAFVAMSIIEYQAGIPFTLFEKKQKMFAIVFIISTGVLIAFLWELVELSLSILTPDIVKDYFYDAWDVLSDILANFIGAVVVSCLMWVSRSSHIEVTEPY